MRKTWIAWCFLFCGAVYSAEPFVQGKDFDKLDVAVQSSQGKPLDIYVFMGFGCPACLLLEYGLKPWIKDNQARATITFVPVALHRNWRPYNDVYFVAKAFGLSEGKAMSPLFTAMQLEQRDLSSEGAKLAMLKEMGIENTKAKALLNDSKFLREKNIDSLKLMKQYNVMSVPMVVVGPYRVSGTQGQDISRMLEIISYLLSKVEGSHLGKTSLASQ